MPKYDPEESFLNEHIFEDCVKRYLRKNVAISARQQIEEQDILADFPYGGIYDWNENYFKLILPSGLCLKYTPQEQVTTFTPLDKEFVEACVEVLGSAIFMIDYTINYTEPNLASVIQFASSLKLLDQPGDQLIAQYITNVTLRNDDFYLSGTSRQSISTYKEVNKFILLVQDVMNSQIEGEGISSGLAFFPTVKSLREACDFLTIFNVKPKLDGFKSLKPFLPIANGKNSFVLIVRDQIYGVGFLRNFHGKSNCKVIYSPISGNPLIAQFFGQGSCAIRGAYEGRMTSLISFVSGQPIIRDEDAAFSLLSAKLKENLVELGQHVVNRFAGLILNFPQHSHGATIIIGDEFPDLVRAFFCDSGNTSRQVLHTENQISGLDEFLLKHSYPDGAILLNKKLKLMGFGAILPVSQTPTLSSSGARHTSALSYSRRFEKILAIVVSQDGPISIFKGGKLIMSI